MTDETVIKDGSSIFSSIKLLDVMETTSDMIIITDNKGLIGYANSKFLDYTKYSLDDLLDKSFKIINSGKQDDDFYKNIWDEVLQGSVWRGEVINKKKDGSFYYAEMFIMPVKDEVNAVKNFFILQRDITETVIIEKKLVHSTKKLSKLMKINNELDSASIDIKNTMLKIKDVMNSLDSKISKEESEEIKMYLGKCTDDIHAVLNIVEKFNMSKHFDFNKILMKYDDILPIIENVVDAMRNVAKERCVKIKFRKQTILHKVFFDELWIEKIIGHILNNAIRFSRDNDEINFNIKEKNGFIEMKISDRGVGILPEVKEKLFANRRDGQINLAICKDVIEQHSGRLFVESTYGEGTNVVVRVPIEKRDLSR